MQFFFFCHFKFNSFLNIPAPSFCSCAAGMTAFLYVTAFCFMPPIKSVSLLKLGCVESELQAPAHKAQLAWPRAAGRPDLSASTSIVGSSLSRGRRAQRGKNRRVCARRFFIGRAHFGADRECACARLCQNARKGLIDCPDPIVCCIDQNRF